MGSRGAAAERLLITDEDHGKDDDDDDGDDARETFYLFSNDQLRRVCLGQFFCAHACAPYGKWNGKDGERGKERTHVEGKQSFRTITCFYSA